jgi:hypothetical protein
VLITAAGLPFQMLLPHGRDPTSTQFLSAPGMPRLNSGVTNSTASAAAIRSRKRVNAAGGSASRSSL